MFKKTCLVSAITLFFLCSQAALAVFSDVASNHPNYEAINYLQENGIIEGYSDQTFRPAQPVNRAEAIKIILLGSDLFVPEIQDQEIFPDVIYGTWYAKYVLKAKNLGIVNGDSDTGMFRPGDTVNLAEALKILLNTNNIATSIPDDNPYPDVPNDSWFAPYFTYAESINLLDQTSEENVNPATPIDRGMLAELMYRLIMKPNGYQEGKASYYGEDFHGETTASGEVFDASAFTAAHRTQPFGTMLKVTNLENNQSVIVRVNDRGPYAGDRIIDLSKAAFESIAALSRGVINVSVIPTSSLSEENEDSSLLEASILNSTACSEKKNLQFLSKTTYENIVLDNEIPNRLVEGEVLHISGKSLKSNSVVSVFMSDSSGGQRSFQAATVNGIFGMDVFFPSTGTFKLGILPGESGSSVVEDIKVLQSGCIKQNNNSSLSAPVDLKIDISNGGTVLSWDNKSYQFAKFVFSQNDVSKTYFLKNSETIIPYYADFADFSEGPVNLSVQGANVTNKSILEPASITWSAPVSATFNATMHHEYILNEDEADLTSAPDYITKGKTFSLAVKPLSAVQSEGAMILPSGSVVKTPLKSDTENPILNSNDVEVFPPSENELVLSYKPLEDGVYFAEINNSDGLAALNIPLYPEDEYPLLPNPVELSDQTPVNLGSDLNALRTKMLNLINADRKAHGKSSLILDSQLNSLGQFRSDDMVKNNYFSHWDKDGMSANDIRKNYAITQVVAENIAKDLNLELAEYGLMRSALHRMNILEDDWTRVGVGITKFSDGSYIFDQIFSGDPINMSDTAKLRQTILSSINESRSAALTLTDNLNTLAQNWSNKMVSQDFFDFTAPDDTSLVETVRDAGINSAMGTYIVGNTSLQSAIDQISANPQITESQWKKVGVGIKQDSLGIIKITLIYTE
jgi:rare lipoprotein A